MSGICNDNIQNHKTLLDIIIYVWEDLIMLDIVIFSMLGFGIVNYVEHIFYVLAKLTVFLE